MRSGYLCQSWQDVMEAAESGAEVGNFGAAKRQRHVCPPRLLRHRVSANDIPPFFHLCPHFLGLVLVFHGGVLELHNMANAECLRSAAVADLLPCHECQD